jgi:hypothetical protein
MSILVWVGEKAMGAKRAAQNAAPESSRKTETSYCYPAHAAASGSPAIQTGICNGFSDVT